MRVAGLRPEQRWATNSDGAVAMNHKWKLEIWWKVTQIAEIVIRLWPFT